MRLIHLLSVACCLAAAVALVLPAGAQAGFCGGQTGYNATYCPSNNSTCCNYTWSPNGWGCCPFPNAVCCANTYTCCPAGTVCQDSGSSYNVVTECVDPNNHQPRAEGKQICKIGPSRPFNTTLKSCLVIGDSVSIGYTPFVATALADICDVQHSPNSGDGGACETAYGLQCLDFFLTSSSGYNMHFDLIYYNFGLHNLVPANGSVVPGQSGYISDYLQPLTNITQRLVAMKTKLIFGLTSAYLCDAGTDDIVLELNSQAATLMAQYGIPTVNLHQAITNKCGPVPQQQCFGEQGCWCPHCPPGYQWLAESTVAPAIRAVLTSDTEPQISFV